MKINPLPSQEYLHECFEYMPDGTLVWKARPLFHFSTAWSHSCSLSNATGKSVGTMGSQGYLIVRMYLGKYFQFLLHRIIWTMHNGPIPEGYLVDHKDTNWTNNKIKNLRLTLSPGNSYNKSLSSNNTSGVKGISWDKGRCSWCARVSVNHKRIYAGHFETLNEAKTAVETIRNQVHGEFTNHGKIY